MTIEEEKQFVLKYVKLGYSPAEILAQDETGTLTPQIIKDRKRALIVSGLISAEEARQKLDERRQKQVRIKHIKDMEVVKKLVEKGYTVKQIAEELESGTAYVSKIIAEYKQDNEWYSNADHKDFQNKNKDVFKERDSILEKLKQGYAPTEIEKMMKEEGFDTTINRVKKVRKQLIIRGIITADEISQNIKEKEKSKISKKHIKDALEIKRLISEGYSLEQIDKTLQIGRNYRNKVLHELEIYSGSDSKENEKNKKDEKIIKEKKQEIQEKYEKQEIEKHEVKKENEEKEKEKKVSKQQVIRAYNEKQKNEREEQEKKKLDQEYEKDRSKWKDRYGSYGKIQIDFKKTEETDSQKELEKIEKQRRYEEIVRRKQAEKQKEQEEKRLLDEHRLHIKAESMMLTDDRVKTKYDNAWKEALNENRREEKGIEEIPTTAREKFFEMIEIADAKGVEMKKKYYNLFEDVLMYHPEMANENLINIYLKKTLKICNINYDNMDVLKEKVGDLSFTFADTKYGKRIKELQYYIDDMSKRRDGWYFISKKISEREEK